VEVLIRLVSAGLLMSAGLWTSPGALEIEAEPVAEGLENSAFFTFAPDGRIFYAERLSGEIRILDLVTGSDTLFFTVSDLMQQGERGLLGLTLHPRYPTSPFVYAYATRRVNGVARNQILAVRDSGGIGTQPRVIFTSNVTPALNHNGGRILFGPDDRLYAAIGDAGRSANSQDFTKAAGKILRMTALGGIPPDNPFPGSRVFAYGIRNSIGFAFDPSTGIIWESDNGPSCNDEINRIEPGQGYGWGPSWTCSEPPPAPKNTNQDGPSPRLPLAWFTPNVAPTGAAFCSGCDLSGMEGSLLYGAFLTGNLNQVVLTADRMGIQSITTVYTHPGSILSIESGPDGRLYFSTGAGIFRLIEV
jgi:glucose/arabinose dehydrogenase